MNRDASDRTQQQYSQELRRVITRVWERARAEEPNKPQHILAREVYADIRAELRARELQAFRILRELQSGIHFVDKEQEDTQ